MTVVRHFAKHVQQQPGIEDVRSLLLSSATVLWVWGNAQFRTGGGPFHEVVEAQWRGYPFLFEGWGWSDSYPNVTIWREFHWLGLVGDILLLAIACYCIVRRVPARRSNRFSLFLCMGAAVFVWLNIEPWVQGVPVTVAGTPGTSTFGNMSSYWSTLARGFPWTYWNTESISFRIWPLIGNVLIGCSGLVLLFRLSRISKNTQIASSG